MATTINSKELTLRNLASDVTREIREQIKNQDILSITLPNYRDENYIGNGGVESIFEIDKNIDAINHDYSKKGLTKSMSFGLYKQGLEDEKYSSNGGALENISLRYGESPVINAPWQFNELDDVRSNTTYPHLGRVYLTYIYANFPILTIQPGREKMNSNLLSFFTKGLGNDHKKLNKYIRSGGDSSLLDGLKIALVSVKNVTLGAIEGVLGLMGLNFADASKFITFKPAMKLYRQLTNNLLREFAANLGLLDLTREKYNDASLNFDVIKNSSYESGEGSDPEYMKSLNAEMKNSGDREDANSVFGDGTNEADNYGETTDFGGVDKKNSGYSVLTNFGNSIVDGFSAISSSYRGTLRRLDVLDMIPHIAFTGNQGGISQYFGDIENRSYLPYLCQSNISISETFSNSTKEHPIVGQINSMSEEASDSRGMGGAKHIIDAYQNIVQGGGKNIGDVGNDLIAKFTTKLGGEVTSNFGEMTSIMNGDGKLLVPEIWSSSSYSRSYSVDFKFWSPVGDIISIFENVYIPYLLLMALAAPLQTGYSSYVSPFAIKVFSKGLFSVDFGMIESLSVTRGDGTNDRTKDNFPRSIKVSVSVKDLAPALMLSLGNGAFWKYKRANSSLSEYIATMCNMSIGDRFDIGRKFEKYWALMIGSTRDKFSLNNIGFNFGGSFFMKPAVAWNRNKVSVDQVNTRNIYM